MNELTKSQKDEYATTFAILALYDGGVSDEWFLWMAEGDVADDNARLTVEYQRGSRGRVLSLDAQVTFP
jgi:hypothetical protein